VGDLDQGGATDMPLWRYIQDRTHGRPADRTALSGSDEKWNGYLLGVEEATRAAEGWVRERGGVVYG
jgi:hypothetical protein